MCVSAYRASQTHSGIAALELIRLTNGGGCSGVEEEEENNTTSFLPSPLLIGTRGHCPAGNLETLDVLYGCCRSCSLVTAGSLLHSSRKRGTIHPLPTQLQKNTLPYCLSFLPLSPDKRLRQEVKLGMCACEDGVFELRQEVNGITVETRWISSVARHIFWYSSGLLCLPLDIPECDKGPCFLSCAGHGCCVFHRYSQWDHQISVDSSVYCPIFLLHVANSTILRYCFGLPLLVFPLMITSASLLALREP